jgi:hypothetical protein
MAIGSGLADMSGWEGCGLTRPGESTITNEPDALAAFLALNVRESIVRCVKESRNDGEGCKKIDSRR